MNQKPDFERSEKIADALLSRQRIQRSCVDVCALNYDKDIIFDTVQNYESITGIKISSLVANAVLHDGCTLRYGDTSIVLCNRNVFCSERLNWTLAHEIGHIYLDHANDGPIEEVEANTFASELLMPEIVIRWLINSSYSVDTTFVCKIFHVSHEAAKKRIATILKLSKQFFSTDEMHILEMFKNVISLRTAYHHSYAADVFM